MALWTLRTRGGFLADTKAVSVRVLDADFSDGRDDLFAFCDANNATHDFDGKWKILVNQWGDGGFNTLRDPHVSWCQWFFEECSHSFTTITATVLLTSFYGNHDDWQQYVQSDPSDQEGAEASIRSDP